ncbi:hypothetical protein ES703_68032 [subsurface metagenome]
MEECLQQAKLDGNTAISFQNAPKHWKIDHIQSFLRFVAALVQKEELLWDDLPKDEVGRVVFYLGTKCLSSSMSEKQVKDLFALLKR